MKFSEQLEARYADMLTHYPVKRSLLVPFLLYIQDELGYVTDEAIEEVAQRLEITALEVRNVISYYSMLRTKPGGKYNVQVCTNICCLLRGGEEMLEHVREKLGVAVNKGITPTVFSRWKKSNALAPAPGPRQCRSTTTSTRTSHRKKSTRSLTSTGKRRPNSSYGIPGLPSR